MMTNVGSTSGSRGALNSNKSWGFQQTVRREQTSCQLVPIRQRKLLMSHLADWGRGQYLNTRKQTERVDSARHSAKGETGTAGID
jgi:hypothetical protein